MILDYNKFKPIRIFAIILIVIGLLGILEFLSMLEDPEVYKMANLFILVVSIWHFLTGIGIVVRKNWGYTLMKVYLFILFTGFPIGTYISNRMLRYIKDNEISLFFRKRTLKI